MQKIKNIMIDEELWNKSRALAITQGKNLREWLASVMVEAHNNWELLKKGGDENMAPQGVCQKCGQVYVGWALMRDQEDNVCVVCGGPVKITMKQDGVLLTSSKNEKKN